MSEQAVILIPASAENKFIIPVRVHIDDDTCHEGKGTGLVCQICPVSPVEARFFKDEVCFALRYPFEL
jgi:hypothetical protein